MKTELREECRGKWTSVLQFIGIDGKYLNGKHQPCLICGGKDRARWVKDKELYYCNRCGCLSPISLAMQYLDLPFKQTAELIRPTARTAKMTNITPIDSKVNEDRLKKIHAGLKRLHSGNAAGLYLLKRGITEPPKANVYFHPGLPYYDDGKKLGLFPAMVSRFQTAAGETATYHITYLNADGTKANVTCPKKFLPTVRDMAGGAIRLSEAAEILGIAEGIETALAAQITEGIPVWACGNAGLMEKVSIPDSVKTVMIFVDEDKSFTGQKAAYTLAHRLAGQGKEIIVTRIATTNGRPELHTERGLGLDYLDYLLAQPAAAIAAVAQAFGPLTVETTLARTV
jgi:putative DNA primase/helicase